MEGEHIETEGGLLQERARLEGEGGVLKIALEISQDLKQKKVDADKYFATIEGKPDETVRNALWYQQLIRAITDQQAVEGTPLNLFMKADGKIYDVIGDALMDLEEEEERAKGKRNK